MALENAVILGASADIGLALLRRLDGQVPLLLAHGNQGADKLKDFAAKAQSSVHVLRADLNEAAQVEGLSRQIEALCQPQALVHLAAPKPRMGRFKDLGLEDYEREMRVQFFGPLALFKALAPAMASRRQGRLLFLLSELTMGPMPSGWAPYASAKFALLALMRSLAVEYADKGVKVGALSPGMVDTGFLEHIHPLVVEQAAQASGLGRNNSADEVAEVLAYLLSPRSTAAQGSNLTLVEAQELLKEDHG